MAKHISWLNLGGENLLRCTTHDEKGLVLNVVLFYIIF